MDKELQFEYFKKMQKVDDDANALQTANKIFDELERLNKYASPNSRRRWIWELLQNAKDLHDEGSRVDILIDLGSNYFTFAHNAKNFTLSHLTNLIKQVSSKDRGNNHINTGKFGTGFLSTHLLSKKVEIRGILDTEELGVLIGFSVLMDRDAQSRDELRSKIESTLENRRNILDLETLNAVDERAFNTSFKYFLGEINHTFAVSGLEDLILNLPYALVFIKELGKVTICHESTTFYKDGIIDLGAIKIYKIIKEISGKKETILIGELKDEDVSVAFELIESQNGSFWIEKMSESLPKLYCDFPLVGTEDFGLPFVLNSPKFDPTEERHGVVLTDYASPEILRNKQIVARGIELYANVLQILSTCNVQSLYNICDVGRFSGKDWLSPQWCEVNIRKPLLSIVLHAPVVRNIKGILTPFLSANDTLQIVIPSAKGVDRVEFYELLKWVNSEIINPEMLPEFIEFESWSNIINEEYLFFDIFNLAEIIASRGNLTSLNNLLASEVDCIVWLNKFYEILVREKSSYTKVKSSQNKSFGIFLNQNEEFVHHSTLKIDLGVSEYFKDLTKLLDVDQRKVLLNKKIIFNDTTLFGSINEEDVKTIILQSISQNTSLTIEPLIFTSSLSNNDKDVSTRSKLLPIFEFFFSQTIPLRKVDVVVTELIQISDKKLLTFVVSALSKLGNLSEVMSEFNQNQEAIIKYIDDLVNFLDLNGFDNLVGGKIHPIIPNQNGKFCRRDELYFDCGLDQDLLDIILSFGVDIREQLMHDSITLQMGERDLFNYQMLNTRISGLISPLTGFDVYRSAAQEESLIKLYQWLISNSILAETHLGEIWTKKHILLSDTVIGKKLEKSEKYDRLMGLLERTGITENEFISYEVLEKFGKFLKQEHSYDFELKPYTTSQVKHFIESSEDLIGYIIASGINSQSDFEDMIERFGYCINENMTTISWANKFEFVHNILKRAVKNVLAHLGEIPSYDLSELKQESITTFSGVKYCGLPINLVIRPNDYKKVIVYYLEELELLKQTKTQFWIDNDKVQRQLTIGDIIQALRAGVIENLD